MEILCFDDYAILTGAAEAKPPNAREIKYFACRTIVRAAINLQESRENMLLRSSHSSVLRYLLFNRYKR